MGKLDDFEDDTCEALFGIINHFSPHGKQPRVQSAPSGQIHLWARAMDWHM